jgi:hypothetical protein
MRRLLACAAVATLGFEVLGGAAVAAEDPLPFRVPGGYRVTYRERISPGVEHVRLESARPVHVVELGFTRPRSGYRVDVRHAGPRSQGSDRRLEGTSALCGDCAYATNGDYAWRRPSRVVGRPIGGVVERGRVLVSPDPLHQQASYTYNGGFTTARVTWSASVAHDGRTLTVTGKNVPRERRALVLYTSDYVGSTGTADGGVELVLALPERAGNVVPNQPTTANMLSLRDGFGDTAVRPGTVVLSGSGVHAVALRRLWAAGGRGTRVALTESLSPDDVWASVGAGHILVRNGRRWLQPSTASHLVTTHPRTFAGVLGDGTLFHATVDGRERNLGRSVGMPLAEAATFFLALGAHEAINMDGGGSTTFVRGGRVVNRPSDGHERPVTTAVVVVPGRLPRPPGQRAAAPVVRRAPRPRPELPDVVTAAYALPPAAPGAVPPGPPWPAWLAAGNIGALLLAYVVMWVRRGRPLAPPA